MAQMWMKLLKIPDKTGENGAEPALIGIDDNFFHMGGHSLKGTVLMYRIHRKFNIKLALKELFKTPTIRGLMKTIERATQEVYGAYEDIQPTEEKEYYPLTPAQKRMYILHRMEQGSIGYNMPTIFQLEKKTEPEKLEIAFRQLIQRHEILRTTFHMVKEEPVQKIHPEPQFKLEKYEIKEIGRKKESKIDHHHLPTSAGPVLEAFVRPFRLDTAPLLRAGILKTNTARCYLLMDVHHIVFDGLSMGIFQEELPRLYEDTPGGLPPLKIQYKDFARWWKEEKTGDKIQQQEKYWLEKYAGEIPVLNLPMDYTRPAMKSFEGNLLNFTLEPGETKKLKQVAANEKTTLYMLLLSLYNILLSKLSGQEEIIAGTPVGGRTHPDVEPLIG
ncbi:MAG: non-ribosomal peptide synthetase, partial [bacterium]|nr:non-ribosomal peptide synthetase [bacterium]